MRAGIQTFLDEAGDAACYALDIIELGRRIGTDLTIGVAEHLQIGISRRFIHYSWDNPDDGNNFYVLDPAGFLGYLTGRRWTVRKEAPDYVPKLGELVVQRWERQRTGETIGHFRLPDWDSLTDSKTVRRGQIVSLRIFAPA